jgi:hypothetical protein
MLLAISNKKSNSINEMAKQLLDNSIFDSYGYNSGATVNQNIKQVMGGESKFKLKLVDTSKIPPNMKTLTKNTGSRKLKKVEKRDLVSKAP